MRLGYIYIFSVIIYGLYRQFIIPDQFYYETWLIWLGALLWPITLVCEIIGYIFDVPYLQNEKLVLGLIATLFMK